MRTALLAVALVVASLSLVFVARAIGDYAEEQDMAECVWHLREIHAAIEMYEADHGGLPSWLSELAPKYLPYESVFFCPADASNGRNGYGGFIADAVDPRRACSYLYEFNPDWRNRKTAMRARVGNRTPIVRCWNHIQVRRYQVLNLDFDGMIYLSETAWETLFADRIYGREAETAREEMRLSVGPPELLAIYANPSKYRLPASLQKDLRAIAPEIFQPTEAEPKR